jgi:hypothetical protein
MFDIIKRKLKSKVSLSHSNFSKKEGMVSIIEAIEEISPETIRRLWCKVMQAVRSGVVHAGTKADQFVNADDCPS